MTDFEKLEKRLDSLEKAFIQAQKNQVPITSRADNASNKIPQIDTNTANIADNSDGLFDISEVVDENSQAIMELAEIIGEMEV